MEQQNLEFSCFGCLSWQDKNVINLKKNLLFFTLSLYTASQIGFVSLVYASALTFIGLFLITYIRVINIY